MKIYLHFLRYSLRYKWQLAVAYALVGAFVVFQWLTPVLIGTGIDDALANGLSKSQLLIGGLIVLNSIMTSAAQWGETYLIRWVAEKSAEAVRNDMSRRLLGLSFGYYDQQRTGDLMSRATSDLAQVQTRIVEGTRRLVHVIALIMLVTAFMFATNWGLALIAIVFMAAYAWGSQLGQSRLRQIYKDLQDRHGTLAAVLQENIAGMRVVQALGAGDYEQDKFNSEATAVADRSLAADRFWDFRGAAYHLTSTASAAAILWVGGSEVVSERLTPGELTSFLLYLTLLRGPVLSAVGWTVGMTRILPSGERILEVLNAESPVREKPGARPIDHVQGHVRFERVSMSYDSSGEAVQDIDFEVQPGQLIAMLGPPGSGKSTLAHLIPRFYDVTAGRVTIDGLDVRDVTLPSLRDNVGIVLQDVFVFGAPFRDNIKLGAPGVTDDDMVRAAKTAQLHDFIESLPDGYDTWVGERGVKLSGGQRQRLAIARTILLDPPILILDDSTSSVDMATEREIQKALSEVVTGRTTFVIAHRLSSVRAADLILVMDGGRIVERGTHRELLELGGYYRHIYEMQLAPTVEQAIAQVTALDQGER